MEADQAAEAEVEAAAAAAPGVMAASSWPSSAAPSAPMARQLQGWGGEMPGRTSEEKAMARIGEGGGAVHSNPGGHQGGRVRRDG